MLTWLFEEVARWKSAEGYTEIIGKDLGIGASSQPHTEPPSLSAGDIAHNNVELLFNLYEHDGIWLESRVQGEAEFSFLATDTGSPYLDTRPVKTAGQSRMARIPRLLVGQRYAHETMGPSAPRHGGRVRQTIERSEALRAKARSAQLRFSPTCIVPSASAQLHDRTLLHDKLTLSFDGI